jgi:hypothetical protein
VVGQLPSGITFVDNGDGTGTLSGVAPNLNAGTYPLTIVATNSIEHANVPLVLTILQSPEIINTPAAATFTEGQANTFTITAIGSPTPILSQIQGYVPGVYFVDNHNGTATLSGTPSLGSGGVYHLSFQAYNGAPISAVQGFTLTIPQPTAFVSVGPAVFVAGQSSTYTVATTGFPTATLVESGALPAGVSFVDNGNGTATLSGTPLAGGGGAYPLTITANNGSTGVVTLALNLVDDPALVITSAASAAFSAIPGRTFAVTTNSLLGGTTFRKNGTLPAGLTFDSSTGVISGSSSATGNYPLIVTAHSADGQTSPPQNLTLTVGQAPALSLSNALHGTLYVGQSGTLTITATGFPAGTFTETGALPSGVTFVDNGNGTASLTGTPAPGTTGAYYPLIQVQNEFGLSGESFSLSVLTVSTPAAITSAPSAAFTAGLAGTFTVTTSGSPTPALTETGALPAGVTFNDNGNGTATISGTPSTSAIGPFAVTITAANNADLVNATLGSFPDQTFVLDVDQPASLTAPGSSSFTVGQPGFLPLQASGFPAPTVTLSGTLPAGVTFDSPFGLVGTPAAGTAGTYPLTFNASNGVGAAAVLSLTLTVSQTAMITSAHSATFVTGQSGSFTVTTTGSPKATITENGSLPAGVTFLDNGNGTATLSGTASATMSNINYSLTVTAHNGIGSDSVQYFNLNVDYPPTFPNPNSTTFTVGQSGSLAVVAGGYPAPTVTVTGNLPTGVTVVDNPDGSATLAGTPVLGTGGTYPLTITASNSAGTATERFSLAVNADAYFTSPSSFTDLVDYPIDITPTASGFPKPTFIGFTGQLPSYISFDPTQDLYFGVPQAVTPAGQPDLIHLTIPNADGTTSTQTVQITVIPQPTLTSSSQLSFIVGQNSSFKITTSSTTTPQLSESGFLPPGLTFVDNGNGTATLSGAPASGTNGMYIVYVSATIAGSSVPLALTLQVNQHPSQAPQFTSSSSVSFTASQPGSFTVTTSAYPAPTIGVYNVVEVELNQSSNMVVPLPSGLTFVDNGNGTATISGTPAAGTAGTYDVTVEAGNSSGSASQTISLGIASLAPAQSLVLSGSSGQLTAGGAFSLTVTARDSSGNVAAGYTGTVSFSSSDGKAVLPGNYTFTAADKGVHTFSFTLKTSGSQSISATDTTASSVTGSVVGTVNAAAPSKFLVSAPASVIAGAAFNATVTVVDAYGNAVPSASGVIPTGYFGTVGLSSSDGQAVLPGAYTFTVSDDGAHTFSATLNTPGTQSITATDTTTTSLTGSDSAITVTAASSTPSKFLISAPATVTAGVAFNVTVTAVNASGNTVTGYTGTVAFSSSDGQTSLPGNYTFTSSDKGVHTFSVTLKTSGTQSVTAKDTKTTLTGSDAAIVVNPAAASKFVVTAQSNVQQGTAFSVTVTAQDAYGNTARGYTGTMAFSSSDRHAVLPGNYTFNLSDQGVHTFGVTLKTAGTQSVTAKDTKTSSLTGSDTQISVSGFTVNDGSPQQSMVTSLIYTFASPTQVEPGAFVLLRDGKPSPIHLAIAPQPGGTTYIITFSGSGIIGGSVPDGNYTLITLQTKVVVLSGPPFTQDDVNTFTRLFGDVNGDNVVNAADKALLKQAEAEPVSPYVAYFDFNGNGVLDKKDIAQFTRRLGERLEPPSKPPATFPGQKVRHPATIHHTSAKAREAGANGVNAKASPHKP